MQKRSIKNSLFRSIPVFLGLAYSSVCISEEKSSATEPVLDFSADVIEGEKRKPDLFLQSGGAATSLDAVIYSREDFNDFHEKDSKWRPRVWRGSEKRKARSK